MPITAKAIVRCFPTINVTPTRPEADSRVTTKPKPAAARIIQRPICFCSVISCDDHFIHLMKPDPSISELPWVVAAAL
jgi:hypothetical protein